MSILLQVVLVLCQAATVKPSLSLSPLILRPLLHLQLLDPAVQPDLRPRGSKKPSPSSPSCSGSELFKSELSVGTLGVNFRIRQADRALASDRTKADLRAFSTGTGSGPPCEATTLLKPPQQPPATDAPDESTSQRLPCCKWLILVRHVWPTENEALSRLALFRQQSAEIY